MARSVTLQQTVELVRTTIAVAEDNLPLLAGADADVVREELLRFSREIAFAAARVYASAAENRGSWDARLEALVIDNLVSGSVVGDPLPSQLAALGWRRHRPDRGRRRQRARRASARPRWPRCTPGSRRLGAGRDGRRARRPAGDRRRRGRRPARGRHQALLPAFGDGPVVVGPVAADVGRRRRGHPGRAERAAGRAGLARRAAAGQRRRAAARARAGRRRRGPGPAGQRRLPPARRRRRRAGRDRGRVPGRRRGPGGDRPRAVRARQHRALPPAAGGRGVRRDAHRAPRRADPAGRADARPARNSAVNPTTRHAATSGQYLRAVCADTYKAGPERCPCRRSPQTPPTGHGGRGDRRIRSRAGRPVARHARPVARAARRRPSRSPGSASSPASTWPGSAPPPTPTRSRTPRSPSRCSSRSACSPPRQLGLRRRRRAGRGRPQRRRADRRRRGRRAVPDRDAVAFAARRGAEMAAACALTPTGMAAVLGGDADEVAGRHRGRRADRRPTATAPARSWPPARSTHLDEARGREAAGRRAGAARCRWPARSTPTTWRRPRTRSAEYAAALPVADPRPILLSNADGAAVVERRRPARPAGAPGDPAGALGPVPALVPRPRCHRRRRARPGRRAGRHRQARAARRRDRRGQDARRPRRRPRR